MTNQIKFTKKNKIAETPAVSGLTMLVEDELVKAQVILAIEDILDDLQQIAENLAKISPNAILPALDFMRNSFGPDATDQFYKSSTSAIGTATTAIQQARELINTQLDQLQNGELSPTNDMTKADDELALDGGDAVDLGGDEAELDLDNAPEPEVDLDLGDEGRINAAGRPRKESIQHNVKALQETSNPDGMILNAYRKAFRESRQATRAVHFVAESFAIDLTDVIDIVQEAAKAVDEGKTWKDEKGKSIKNKDWSKDREEKKKSREDSEEVAEGKTFKDEKDKSSKNKDWSKARESKKRERPSDIDEAKKPDADKDGIPNWADKNPFKAGGKEDRKPSKKS